MIQIALETSTRNTSACLADGPVALGQMKIEPPKVATQCLIPGIQSLLENSGLGTSDVDQISISIGPGSFTGLRLGVALAKTFAFANGCSVFQCCTHSVVAWQTLEFEGFRESNDWQIATVINAQRNQWFAANHQPKKSDTGIQLTESADSRVVDPTSYVESLRNNRFLLVGDGLARPPKDLVIPGELSIADESTWIPRAETVAKVAALAPELGQLVKPIALMPNYGRKSAAEEKLSPKS